MSAIPALSIFALHKSLVAGTPGCMLSASVLRGVSLCVAPAETVAIVSSCPLTVTTLLRCAAGLLRPDAGQVRWFGKFPALAGTHFVPAFVDAGRLAPFRDALPSARLLVVDGPLDRGYDDALAALLRIARREGIAMLAGVADGMGSLGLFHRRITLRAGRVDPAAAALIAPPARVAEPRPEPFG